MPQWLKEELPAPARRDRLPKPAQKEKSVSLWSLIKECVGKDLTRICLPVYFNEPLSALQKTAEDLEYSELIDAVRPPSWRAHVAPSPCTAPDPTPLRELGPRGGALHFACKHARKHLRPNDGSQLMLVNSNTQTRMQISSWAEWV